MEQSPNQLLFKYANEKVYQSVSILEDGTIVDGVKIRRNIYKNDGLGFFRSVEIRISNLLSTRKPLYNRALWCTDEWSHGYFHWFIDMLQRYLSVKKEGLTLLLPARYSNLPYVVASLNILNIPYHFIRKNESVKVSELILPTYYKPRGYVFNDLIEKLARSFRGNSKELKRKKIYISRAIARRRKISNEIEVLRLLQENNFQVIQMESLSWRDQLSISQNASIMAGLHGAGLTNMLFMPPSSTIVEIMMKGSAKQVCYRDLARGLGHEYHCFFAEPSSEEIDPHIGSVVVDISELKKLLQEVL